MKLNAKSKVNLHNRFDIEVNGEIIGHAENIVLDQMYTRLCGGLSYFNNIHFGTGSGTPTPERTALFTHLGTKGKVTDEIIKAFPNSKYTSKITLDPEEFVGERITEVGIAFGSNNTDLVTHAMIKDSEGNPLSITKTALDVVVIYATVFISLNDTNELKFVKNAFGSKTLKNQLLDYLVGGSLSNMGIAVGKSNNDLDTLSNSLILAKNSPTVAVDVPNKKRVYSTRFSITQGNQLNMGIDEFSLYNVLRYRPTISENIVDFVIGTGDGTKLEFEIPFVNIINLEVKIDGVPTTPSQHIDSNYSEFKSMLELIDTSYSENLIMYWMAEYYEENPTNNETSVIKLLESINGKKLFGEFMGSYSSASQFIIDSSPDGITWTKILHAYSSSRNPTNWSVVVQNDDLYFKIRSASYVSQYIRHIRIEEPKPKVVFLTPPPIGGVLTFSGNVPYYPKTENYVLDVAFEIIFGEG